MSVQMVQTPELRNENLCCHRLRNGRPGELPLPFPFASLSVLTLTQIVVTIIIFFGSRKFHASYGFFSQHVNANRCRRGQEWLVIAITPPLG
jgi:hypothetical protein